MTFFDKRSLLLTMAPPTLTALAMADGPGETLICTPTVNTILTITKCEDKG